MVRFYVFLPLPNLLDLLTSIVMLLVAPKFYIHCLLVQSLLWLLFHPRARLWLWALLEWGARTHPTTACLSRKNGGSFPD